MQSYAFLFNLGLPAHSFLIAVGHPAGQAVPLQPVCHGFPVYDVPQFLYVVGPPVAVVYVVGMFPHVYAKQGFMSPS